MRQLIIARKDLQMSPGKLAAQVSHASMAFLSHMIHNGGTQFRESMDADRQGRYEVMLEIPQDVYEEWFDGIFTKTICEAKNKNQLMKAAAIAEELGLKENADYFLIHDACLTELQPEEEDGSTLTCIGFRPLPDDVAHTISRKFQLYR